MPADRSGTPDHRGDPAAPRRRVGRDGRRVGRRAGHRPRPRVPHDQPGPAHRARGPRGARPLAPGGDRSPSRRRRRGGSSSGSRNRGASAGAGPRARRTWRSATTGAGSGASSRSARSARATRSSSCSSGRSSRPTRRSSTHPGDAELSGCATGCRRSSCSCGCSTARWASCSRLEPTELERALRLLGDVPDDTILRLVKLLDGLPDDDVLGLVDALCRLSPTSARRATTLMSGVVRTLVR